MENNAVMTVLFKEVKFSKVELTSDCGEFGCFVGYKYKNYLSVELRKWDHGSDCDRIIEIKQTIDGVEIPDYHSYALGPDSHAIRLAIETFDRLLAQNPKLSKKDMENA